MKIKAFAIIRKSKNGEHKLLFRPNGELVFFPSVISAHDRISRLEWLSAEEPWMAPVEISIGFPSPPGGEKEEE
jgi:hypothetical protein